MGRTRLLTQEQLDELLATKNKQERIKLGIKFNLGHQTIINLYTYYKNKESKSSKDIAQQEDYTPLQMIMLPNLAPNAIKVNGTTMEFPNNRAVIQGIEVSW